jgi:hypothetical protein
MPARASITDSPWFWAYLFGVAALIGALLIALKYGPRQAQIEREYQGRERALEVRQGQPPQGQLSTPTRTVVPLRPLLAAIALATAGAWLLFWYTRNAPARAPQRANGGANRPP